MSGRVRMRGDKLHCLADFLLIRSVTKLRGSNERIMVNHVARQFYYSFFFKKKIESQENNKIPSEKERWLR